MPKSAGREYFFTTAVWGGGYVSLFLDLILPNFLASENILSCAKYGELRYEIYTSQKDVDAIAGHENYRRLATVVHASIIPLLDDDTIANNHKYYCMALCNTQALRVAHARKAVILNLPPDCLFTNGGLEKICAVIDGGKKAVLMSAFRLNKEEIRPIVLERFYNKATLTISLPSREFMDIAVQHLHPNTKHCFWDAEIFAGQGVSHIFWKVEKSEFAAKQFHMHPLAVDLSGVSSQVPTEMEPVDTCLLEWSGIASEDCYRVTDSDFFFVGELSPKDMDVSNLGLSKSQYRSLKVLFYAWRCTDRDRDNFINYTVKYKTSDNSDWESVEKNIQKDMRRVIPYINRPGLFSIPIYLHKFIHWFRLGRKFRKMKSFIAGLR